MRTIKILAVPLLLAIILVLLAFPGCGGKGGGLFQTTSGELSDQELQQVITDAMSAVRGATSYAFSLDMDMNAEATGGTQAGKMGMNLKSNGKTDITADNVYMDMDMSVEQEGQGSQSVSAEMYMFTDWLYMNLKMSGVGEGWVKTPVNEATKQDYNLDVVGEQLAPLESMGKIGFVKYESVDGSQCYVLQVVPDLQAMKEWLDEEQLTAGSFDWSQVENLGDIFKEIYYTLWVAKDTKLIKKMQLAMSMELTAAQAGVTESDFDKMTMDIAMSMALKDFNKPVSIILPDEAKDAEEM